MESCEQQKKNMWNNNIPKKLQFGLEQKSPLWINYQEKFYTFFLSENIIIMWKIAGIYSIYLFLRSQSRVY